MDLREYLLLLLRRWPSFVLAFASIVALGVGASLLMEPTYEASASVYVSADPVRVEAAAGSQGDFESALSAQERGDELVAERLKSYAMAINSEAVLLPVIEELDLGGEAQFGALNRRVSAEVVSDSRVIEVTVTDRTAGGAADVANGIVASLPSAVARLDGARGPQASLAQFAVLQRALPPQDRVSPNLKLNGALALVLGLFAGALAAVLTETFDNRLRRGSQVSASGARHLGSLPELKERVRATLLVPDEQPPEVRNLFTRLAVDVRIAAGPGPLRLLVTSPREGSGTTSVAANLAARLAAAGEQVLYVDTDTSDRSFSRVAGLADGTGLSDVVAGNSELETSLTFWQPGGFTVLPHGRSTVNAADLLGGASFRSLLETADRIFDAVVLDAPTMRHSPEAGLLLREVPNVLLVVGARRTRRAEFRAAIEAVQRSGATVVGSVLTRATRSTTIATAAEEHEAPEAVAR
ncbi:hypothetical protein QWY28_16550 [Nocardioides sp. SOB77]|uniref:Uncharacterized protein n=1 Tax=Nocardioides oceani TaxID=3058369 RepID=A0ABT8FIR4_9ACTN|nr:hypothetical protein [Nocardioides oceani]MDN4174573.1 hypothetical protein [Nocardioides oceani]